MSDPLKILGLFAVGTMLTFGFLFVEVWEIGASAAISGDIQAVGSAIIVMLLIIIAVLIVGLAKP